MKRLFLCSLLFGLVMSSDLWASGLSTPRSVGMGGAYLALARGVESPRWNPANLGLSDHHRFSVNLVSFGVGAGNNSFSKSLYDLYNGTFLDENDKRDILDRVPEKGLGVDSEAEVQVLGLAYKYVALTQTGVIASDLTLAKDFLDLTLFGNELDRRYSFEGSEGQAWAVSSFGLSAGIPVSLSPFREFAVGLSAKYLLGFAYAEVIEARGFLLTTWEKGIETEGGTTLRTAMGGSGVAFDVGVAGTLNERWSVSLSLLNPISTITWSKDAEEQRYAYSQKKDSLFAQDFDEESDSLFETTDEVKSIGSFGSKLPAELRAGAAYTTKKLIVAFDYTQGFTDGPGVSTTPKLAAGLEYRPVQALPLRAGLSVGGKSGFSPSVGFGFDFGPVDLDFAASYRGGMFAGSKGLSAAFGLGLGF